MKETIDNLDKAFSDLVDVFIKEVIFLGGKYTIYFWVAVSILISAGFKLDTVAREKVRVRGLAKREVAAVEAASDYVAQAKAPPVKEITINDVVPDPPVVVVEDKVPVIRGPFKIGSAKKYGFKVETNKKGELIVGHKKSKSLIRYSEGNSFGYTKANFEAKNMIMEKVGDTWLCAAVAYTTIDGVVWIMIPLEGQDRILEIVMVNPEADYGDFDFNFFIDNGVLFMQDIGIITGYMDLLAAEAIKQFNDKMGF